MGRPVGGIGKLVKKERKMGGELNRIIGEVADGMTTFQLAFDVTTPKLIQELALEFQEDYPEEQIPSATELIAWGVDAYTIYDYVMKAERISGEAINTIVDIYEQNHI